MMKFNSKVVYQKCVFSANIRNDYLSKINYCKLYIDCKSNKYILTIFFKLEALVIPVAIESLLYLIPSIFVSLEKITSPKTYATCQLVFFQFHNNNSITISRSKKWITITAFFRNRNISCSCFEFCRPELCHFQILKNC